MLTAQYCNILPDRVKEKIGSILPPLGLQNVAVGTDYTARRLLADNIERLMALPENSEKNSPAKLARVARWPAGKKKGEPVSERQIRYALDTREDVLPPVPSPTLDFIVAIANAFGVPSWQMLSDDRLLKLWSLGKLFTISESVSDADVEKHLPLPPRETDEKRKPPDSDAEDG